MQNCNHHKKQCDDMTAGWFNKPCHQNFGGLTRACRQCYQQARSLENQCLQQNYEDQRFDEQTEMLVENFKEIGTWLGIGLLVALFLYVIFK